LSGTPPEWFWSGYQKITAECFVGYQYTTPNAETGEKEAAGKITTGTVCKCGNTDHRAHIRLLGDVQRLLDRLVHEEDVELDQSKVFDAYLSGKSIDEAVGEAVAKN
jgi:hypothetical protein